jgi:AraC-like DNA-binding protein
MELRYKSTNKGLNHSFHVRRENIPYHDGNWHYHEEFELIYIIEGQGIRIVGDNMSNFRPPQLAFVGQWLPHLWKNVESDSGDGLVDIIVIKFNPKFSGHDIFSIPEFYLINELLKQSGQGLLFGKSTIDKVHDDLIRLSNSSGAERLIKLIQILEILSYSSDAELLCSPEFTLPVTTVSGENRLSMIINYISNNFTREISLEELAQKAAMTPSSLCRYFKSQTNKTVFGFINEFRVGKACQMLIAGNHSISEICFQSGFNSVTTFNRVFKEIKYVTPSEFKNNYRLLNQAV